MWRRSAWVYFVASLALSGCGWLLPPKRAEPVVVVTVVRQTVALSQPFDAVLAKLDTQLPALNGRLKRSGGPHSSIKIVLVGSDADVRLKPLPGGQALKFKAAFQGDASSAVAARVQSLLEAVRAAAAAAEPTTDDPEAPRTPPIKE